MEFFINDLFCDYNIDKSEANANCIKALVSILKEKELCQEKKQRLNIEKSTLDLCIDLYKKISSHFDFNYNRKNDYMLFCRYIASSLLSGKKINFYSLFCPGYTRYGYKDHLGNTTLWKLKELSDIRKMLDDSNIQNSFINYYSDVFLENTDDNLEPCWQEQLNRNRELFHLEGEKYFESNEVLDASSIPIFQNNNAIQGYVNPDIIKSIKASTYNAFVNSNRKFYESLEFTEEQMKNRNDRLITMYRELSDYLNTLSNVVFLPMENMYERENIFSENGTCTMYLRLKR